MNAKNILLTVVIVVIVNVVIYNIYNTDEKVEHHHKLLADIRQPLPQQAEPAINYPGQQHETGETGQEYRLQRANDVTRAVNQTESAVVSINVIKTQVVRRSTNPFENPFFGFFDYRPYRRQVQSIGSGIIYNEDGYIITNAHVVEGATEIKVILEDGKQYDAEIAGKDRILDIAVLKIDAQYLPAITLGDSSDLLLGETVVAIGNPYAFLIKDSKPSVSVGVISAVNRNFAQDTDGKVYQGMIQTDAAINPGNSGGPLINILGEAIGMNTFIFSESGGSIGVGFAIPIDRVKRIADEIIEYGRRRQIWFGFKIQDINPMVASYLELDDLNGVIVNYIESNSPAARAGLKRGDIIREISGKQIKNANDAEIAILEFSIGEQIELKILRGNQTRVISFEAVERRT